MSYELTLTLVNGQYETNASALAVAVRSELERYRYLVTEDSYESAKADKAYLNKIAKQIKETRLAEERRIKQPLEAAKVQLMALEKEIEAVSNDLKSGIESIDSKKFKERCKRYQEIWNTICNDGEVHFNFDPVMLKYEKDWQKKSCRDSDAERQMLEEYKDLHEGLFIINSRIDGSLDLQLAKKQYLDHCDLKKALADIEILKQIHEESAERAKEAKNKPAEAKKHAEDTNTLPKTEKPSDGLKTYVWKTRGTKDAHNRLYMIMVQMGIELVGSPEVVKEENDE